MTHTVTCTHLSVGSYLLQHTLSGVQLLTASERLLWLAQTAGRAASDSIKLNFRIAEISYLSPLLKILFFKLKLFVSEVSQLFPSYYLTGLKVITIILFNRITWGQPPSQKISGALLTHTISIDIPSCCHFARSRPQHSYS